MRRRSIVKKYDLMKYDILFQVCKTLFFIQSTRRFIMFYTSKIESTYLLT